MSAATCCYCGAVVDTTASEHECRPHFWLDDRAKCDGCGKIKDRVIRRQLGAKSDKRRLCDECFEETKK